MSIVTFTNNELACSFKAITVNNMAYFRAKDVATALGYKNTKQAIIFHVDEEDKENLQQLRGLDSRPPSLSENEKRTMYINESGMYSLVMRSDKPEAKAFKRWVTSEVLPQLRRTGQYAINSNILSLTSETSLHYRIIHFIRKYYPDTVIIPGLGENQDTSTKRIDSKSKGYQAGQPDIILATRNSKHIGFAIELKTPKGTGSVSDKQQRYLHNLQEQNYKVIVSHDYDEVTKQIHDYMASRKFCCHLCKNNRFAHSFKTKEKLHTHIKVIHNIDPNTHEKLTKQSYIHIYDNDKKYIIYEGHMLKITHETKRRYILKQVRAHIKKHTILSDTVQQLTVTYNPDALEKEKATVAKALVDGSCSSIRFNAEDINASDFTFAKVTDASGGTSNIYQGKADITECCS